ncbi:CLC_0170 family protein [Shouchella shacheensis]|uniref:CLC_0170 family protein n=1 Tax=Shouchella shacheensis TaxID=1649580 RepID=UPI000740159F|nr:CLC_0170 family protein [Shouchella shacheensis]
MLDIGYMNYIVTLFVVTGALILSIDVNAYGRAKKKKEKWVATFLGWVNVSLGIVLFIANWAYERWFW